MKNKIFSIFTLFSLILFGMGCDPDNCDDAICGACPSSRFVMRYQDVNDKCPSAFHQGLKVYGTRSWNLTDTIFEYDPIDSCTVSFLLDTGITYFVFGIMANGDTIDDFLSFENRIDQEPLQVNSCCFCYPAKTVDLILNGSRIIVPFPQGEYDTYDFPNLID